jgi:hypothetical protein
MKKYLILTLFTLLFALQTIAQVRRRTTPVFNADTTKPAPGFYGISVKDGQPYLMDAYGIHNRIETSPRFIEARSYGVTNKNVTLTTTQEKYVIICGDSVTINLPNPALLKDDSITYTISYLGYPNHATNANMANVTVDNLCRLTFPDTIRGYHSNEETYLSTTLTHNSERNWNRLVPFQKFQLFVWKNKWYIRRDLSHYKF